MAYSIILGPSGRLNVDDGGVGGIPVVFLHSYSGSAAHWSAQLDHLRSTRRAIAFDLRGHGRSEAPKSMDAYKIESMADDVVAVAAGLGLDRFVLVGHSIGGAVANAYAATHPDRVAGLVLVGTPGKSPPEQATQVLGAMEADFEPVMQKYWEKLLTNAKPDVREQLGREMKSIPRKSAFALIKAIFDFDPLPGLKIYGGPKLAIVTDHNNQPNDLHKAVPGLPYKVIGGTSHWPHLDKPDAFNAILDEFLKTTSRSTPISLDEARKRRFG